MAKIKKINHVAIAVEDIQAALGFWQDALGIPLDHIEDVPSQQAQVAFLPVGSSEVELVQPTSEETGTARFLKERGGGMHHLCLEVDDIEETLQRLKDANVELIDQDPRQGHGGVKFAFIHPKASGGTLVELYQVPRTNSG